MSKREITAIAVHGWNGGAYISVREHLDELHRVEWTFRLAGLDLNVHRVEHLSKASKRHRKWVATDTWPENRSKRPVPSDEVAKTALAVTREAITIERRS